MNHFIRENEKKEWQGMAASILQLINVLHAFKKTKRTGWNKTGENGVVETAVDEAESVADHSYGLIFLCFIVGTMFNKINKTMKLDIMKMLIMALIHDLPEAVDGDEITATERNEEKRAELEATKRIQEEKTMRAILSSLDDEIAEMIFQYFIEYLDLASIEAKIVYQLDKVETVTQSFNYSADGEIVDPFDFLASYDTRIKTSLFKEIIDQMIVETGAIDYKNRRNDGQ